MSFDYDLFVIGAGSGGVRAARMSAGMARAWRWLKNSGRRHMRYSWLRAKKLFVYASHYAELFEEAAGFGWRVGARI